MRIVTSLVLALTLALSAVATTTAQAGARDPLFISLTSDDEHRVDMALAFGGDQLERGHPLTLFLNDRAVSVAATKKGDAFSAQQAAIKSLMSKGATVLVCGVCLKHYGVDAAALLPGVAVGDAERVGAALFQDNAKTLTW